MLPADCSAVVAVAYLDAAVPLTSAESLELKRQKSQNSY